MYDKQVVVLSQVRQQAEIDLPALVYSSFSSSLNVALIKCFM